MIEIRMRYALTAALTLMALPLGAAAQLSADGGPIQINADTSDIFDKENRVEFIGNVDVLQGDARLRADKIIVYFSDDGEEDEDEGAFGSALGDELESIRAIGNVFYITPTQKARGDVGTYNAATEVIRLTGSVVVSNDDDVGQGDCLIINPKTGRSTLGCEGGSGRTTIILNPDNGSTSGTDVPEETN